MNITRDFSAMVEDVSTQERMITARINTSSVDRFHTVIDPKGIDFTAYKKNPCVLWEHGKDPTRGSLPIGQNKWLKNMGSEIRARTQFGKDDYSQALFEMYRDGLLRGWSVRVLPEPGTFGPPTKAEIKARPELSREWKDEGGRWQSITMYRKGELAEYSAVCVTGNAECLSLLESRGIWFPETARDLGEAGTPGGLLVKPAAPKQDEKEDNGEQDAEYRFIRKKGEKFVVYSEAGKVLGTHDTRESAVKQLQAIEAHKHDGGRSLIMLRREMADDFKYMEQRLVTRMRDLSDLLKGRV